MNNKTRKIAILKVQPKIMEVIISSEDKNMYVFVCFINQPVQ